MRTMAGDRIMEVAVGLGPLQRLSGGDQVTRSRFRLGRRLYPYVIAGALLEPWLLSSS
jgi:hypothetical protein